ncbi:MAG: transporter, partial [Rhodoferax sp.]|nr:transporter [Rhodoferax sp.]
MTPNKMLAVLALALGSLSAPAADLMTIWQAARLQDPQGRVLQAARDAGTARLGQASALWQPTVGLQATAGLGGADSRLQGAEFSAPGMPPTRDASFATSVQAGALLRWNLAVSQPLHSAERRAQTRQLELLAQAANLEWEAGLQDWMLSTAQRYFDLVLADHRLTLLLRQQAAVERALTEARDRYALGDIPITDTHEA